MLEGGEGGGGTRLAGGDTGYRRVFHRISRVRPLMRSQIWYADLDEFFSDSSYDSAFGGADLYGWQEGEW